MYARKLFFIGLIALIGIIGLTTSPVAHAQPKIKTMDATVAYVLDGDTAVLDNGATIHYVGVDAPKYGGKEGPSEPFGLECYELNRRLVAGKRVRLELDVLEKNPKGELLVYVHVDKYFVNVSLVQSGYAQMGFRSPNLRYMSLFDRLQDEAREGRRGLWKVPREIPAFGNDALEAASKPAPHTMTNQDLEKYDIPGEPEGPPTPPEDETSPAEDE